MQDLYVRSIQIGISLIFVHSTTTESSFVVDSLMLNEKKTKQSPEFSKIWHRRWGMFHRLDKQFCMFSLLIWSTTVGKYTSEFANILECETHLLAIFTGHEMRRLAVRGGNSVPFSTRKETVETNDSHHLGTWWACNLNMMLHFSLRLLNFHAISQPLERLLKKWWAKYEREKAAIRNYLVRLVR